VGSSKEQVLTQLTHVYLLQVKIPDFSEA